jgi:succinyl-CoA synthetase beta subunit
LKYRAVLDAMINIDAHAKFVHKELDKLEADERKDNDAAIKQPEPAA